MLFRSLAGFVVLIGAAGTGAPARSREAAILKSLGATRAQILRSFLLRAGLLGAAAAIVALAAGLTGAWAVNHFVFDSDFAVIWPSAFTIIACGILANLIANIGFSLRALQAKPAQMLRGEG